MIVGSSSDLHPWNFADDDFASSTDIFASTWHTIVTYRDHRPIFDDAKYSALSVAWPSVPPNSFPTTSGFFALDCCSASPDNPIPRVSARLRKSKHRAPRSNQLVLSRSNHLGPRSLLNQIGEASLKCAFRCVRCAQGFGPMQETRWLAHQSTHLPTGRSTPLAHRSTHFLTRPSTPLGIQRQEAMDPVDVLSRFIRRIGNSYDHRYIVVEPSGLTYDLFDLSLILPPLRFRFIVVEPSGLTYDLLDLDLILPPCGIDT